MQETESDAIASDQVAAKEELMSALMVSLGNFKDKYSSLNSLIVSPSTFSVLAVTIFDKTDNDVAHRPVKNHFMAGMLSLRR